MIEWLEANAPSILAVVMTLCGNITSISTLIKSLNFITTIKFGNDLNQIQKEYIDSEIKRGFKLYLNHTKFVNEE